MTEGLFAYPDDTTRLQGGLCANNPRAWDALTEGPNDPHKLPSPAHRDGWELAKDMCLDCSIFVRCYEQRMQHRYGVWGGTDQLERHNQRKAAQRAGARERAKEKAKQAPERPQTAPQAVPEPAVAASPLHREFPVEDPPGYDGWVRIRMAVRSAFYVAQTADGLYFKMKLKGDKAPMVKWLPVADVDLRRSAPVQIREWAGRPRTPALERGITERERDGVQAQSEAA